MATAPKLVLSDLRKVDIRSMGAENVLKIEDNDGSRIIHCRDGSDRTIEEVTISKLRERVSDEDQQDIWINPKFAVPEGEDDLADDLFGSDYPRGPIVDLGLLARSGAVYDIKQDPFSVNELTDEKRRAPFLHAIFRQECNNGKQDPWPSVVLPEEPSALHWAETMQKTLLWRQGEQLLMRSSHTPWPITKLSTSRGRAEHCVAVFESGEVWRWPRDQKYIPVSESGDHEPWNHPAAGTMDIPPTDKIALGLSLGAIVTLDGKLYVFSLLTSTERDIYTPHIADLDDGTSQHRMPRPFEPRLASINAEGVHFVDIAAGDEHLVALTSDGRVYTVGSGFQGALGIGERQFQLDNNVTRSFDWSQDATQFSEDWQEIIMPANEKGSGGKGSKVVQVAAGYQSTILVTSANQ